MDKGDFTPPSDEWYEERRKLAERQLKAGLARRFNSPVVEVTVRCHDPRKAHLLDSFLNMHQDPWYKDQYHFEATSEGIVQWGAAMSDAFEVLEPAEAREAIIGRPRDNVYSR